MDGKPEGAEGAPPEAAEEDFIDVITPDDIPAIEPPEPLIFKWKPRNSPKPLRHRIELRWPDDVEGFQMAYQDAEQAHREAYLTWRRGGKKPSEIPQALWGHYRLVRRTLIAKPTWLHGDASVANMPPPVLLQFHAALLERGIGVQDFRVDTGRRSQALEELKALLSTSGLGDGLEPYPETSENEPTSPNGSSSTPPSESKSETNGLTESATPSTPSPSST